MKYRFFSRKNGYNGSDMIAKYYYTDIIEDNNNITNNFINKSGKEINLLIQENKENKENKIDLSKITNIEKLSKIYYDWYYYYYDTKITESRVFV